MNSKHFKEKKKDPMVLTGTFFHYDEKNRNGRIYSEETAQDMVDQFGKIDHPVYGEFNPLYDNVSVFSNSSHEITNIRLNKDNTSIDGDIKILETDKGNELLKFIKDGNILSVSSRGFGYKEPNGNVKDYKLISFDLIDDVIDANESKSEFIKDSYDAGDSSTRIPLNNI